MLTKEDLIERGYIVHKTFAYKRGVSHYIMYQLVHDNKYEFNSCYKIRKAVQEERALELNKTYPIGLEAKWDNEKQEIGLTLIEEGCVEE